MTNPSKQTKPAATSSSAGSSKQEKVQQYHQPQVLGSSPAGPSRAQGHSATSLKMALPALTLLPKSSLPKHVVEGHPKLQKSSSGPSAGSLRSIEAGFMPTPTDSQIMRHQSTLLFWYNQHSPSILSLHILPVNPDD
ncbi:hypothetical protein GYMLUDRAFT_248531 [Collybiopsis luxurians FD-317 M1]|uniref:Uncharacterized protein n=1 Tax=Collybiopsis luxurians FD-317 M1 TaxID=944289 RepID=A0A0D0CCA7_9AGAR|nr:hypothetical protein GYMLUDRAFT_248531 [Collybiopsis luxurians FD-317 M1]